MDAKRIVIIDDEPNFVEMVKERLEANGFEVLEALTGEEGLEKASSGRVDLVLLDIVMPDIDGYTILKKLRSNEDTKKIPIIVVTGKPDMKGIFDVEGVDAIVKPFEDGELMGKINKALEG